MCRLVAYTIVLLSIILLSVPVLADIVVQYTTLASFDFLSSDEVAVFANVTVLGDIWNTTLTSYSVSNGKLNISNTDTVDVFLVYPVTLNGYVEVTLDSGIIGVFTNYNGTGTTLVGFEIVKDANGITVYVVNGSSKTVVSSLSTTETTIIVTVMDGVFKVTLPDGTGVYEDSISDAVLALGAPASDGTTATYGIFDKIVIYAASLAGRVELDLGTKTVTSADRVAEFTYDVSKYNIKRAVLVVTMETSDDTYARYYIISTSDPGQVFWNPWPSSYITRGIVGYRKTVRVDVTSIVLDSPKGTFYIGVSTFTGSWTISVKLVLDTAETSTTVTATTGGTTVELVKADTKLKYVLLGVGALTLVLLLVALTSSGRKRRGIAPLLAVILVFLVVGGIAAAVLAWLHPEYLSALAMGLGAIALIALLMFIVSGRTIPNPFK